jgi:hypothetical protein
MTTRQDELQRVRLHLPKGDLLLADGRSLRHILGYDLSKIKTNNQVTRQSFLESAGWAHRPSGLLITAGVEDSGQWGPLLHCSMSYPDHDPTWVEIKMMRALFFPPTIDAMMMLPKASDYINVHPHCFHLWQCPQEWGLL